jgi:hypothetical protein
MHLCFGGLQKIPINVCLFVLSFSRGEDNLLLYSKKQKENTNSIFFFAGLNNSFYCFEKLEKSPPILEINWKSLSWASLYLLNP